MALASAMNMSGVDASKPTSGFIAGRIYLATDTQKLYYDNGTALVGYSFGSAMTLLASDVVTGSVAASITLSAISGSYHSLMLVVMGRGDTSAVDTDLLLQLNSDTASDYAWSTALVGNNALVGGSFSDSDTAAHLGYLPAATATANVAGQITIMVPEYAATTFYKTFNGQGSTWNGHAQTSLGAGIWKSTAAVTAIALTLAAGNFAIGTTARLYGIL